MDVIQPEFPLPITTPRLLIRVPQIEDSTAANAAVLESLDELRPFMDWAQVTPSLAKTEEFIRAGAADWIANKNAEAGLPLFIFDKKTNEFIGATSIHHLDWVIPSLETGYWVRTSRAREGLITEAINAMTQYAFKQLGAKRIGIRCDKDNIRSKKIPERLGYSLEAMLKDDRKKPMTGEVSDTLVYARYNLAELPHLTVTWINS